MRQGDGRFLMKEGIERYWRFLARSLLSLRRTDNGVEIRMVNLRKTHFINTREIDDIIMKEVRMKTGFLTCPTDTLEINNSSETDDILDNIDFTAKEAASCRQGKRRSIWEVKSFYHCSTIGTCLTLSEQRKILTKEKIDIRNCSLYEMHCIMLSNVGTGNRISRRVNNLLDRKYHDEIVEFSNFKEQEFLSIWNRKLKEGQICGLYWAAVSSRSYSDKMLLRLFGDVHMLSHLNGGEIRGSLQEAARVKDENIILKGDLREEKKIKKQMMKNMYVLEKNLTNMNEKYRDVIIENRKLIEKPADEAFSGKLEELEAENKVLRDRCEQNENRLKGYEMSIASLKDRKKAIQSELAILRENSDILARELSDVIKQVLATCRQCNNSCPAFDLCEKRILIVGGIKKMKNLYRELIEGKGGAFDYHDGYMHGGEGILREKVERSDFVLCPVDVNSHNACLSVKKICKKIDKPYWMLSSSSLSSITQSLIQLGIQAR